MTEKQPVGIRRIVTGHDSSGKAIVIADGPTPGVKTTPNRPGVIFHNMWTTKSAPARYDGPEEETSVDLPLPPPTNGTTFRLIEFPPENQVGTVDEKPRKRRSRNTAPTARCSTKTMPTKRRPTVIPSCTVPTRSITRSACPAR